MDNANLLAGFEALSVAHASPKSTLLTLLDRDRSWPIFNLLTSTLSTEAIIALSRTCRQLSSLYRDMIPTYWDLDRRLQRFVKDPIAFRQLLSDADGIISGGFALQFIDRKLWDESDLDVCIQTGASADAIETHISTIEGYDLASQKVAKYSWTEVEKVCQYDRYLDNGERRQIELIWTRKHPIHSAMTTYTTALVNFITADAAYSIFPRATFVHRQSFPLREPDYFNGVILIRKYVERGWSFEQRLPRGEELTPELMLGLKRVHGFFSWRIPLSTEGLTRNFGATRLDKVQFCMTDVQSEGMEWMEIRVTNVD